MQLYFDHIYAMYEPTSQQTSSVREGLGNVRHTVQHKSNVISSERGKECSPKLQEGDDEPRKLSNH